MNLVKDPRQATTVKIRRDRHGNAYMADANDDLTDSGALVYSGRHAQAMTAIFDALDLALIALAKNRPGEAQRLIKGILAARRA
jgi:hypothetical protein